jgi:hypothetical protein
MRFPNLSNADRTEIAYATVPFAQGEWNGVVPLKMTKDGKDLDSVIEPMGARYLDGSVRYGRSLTRLTIPANQTIETMVVDGVPSFDSPFIIHPTIKSLSPNSVPIIGIRNGSSWINSTFATNLILVEDNRLRKVFQTKERLGNFVADLKIYLMSNQQLVKFEISLTGSNPTNTLFTYSFDEIRLALSGPNNYINVRGMNRRGVTIVDPYKIFRLMSGPGYFGDGQKQSWYGEIMPSLNASDTTQVSNARAALEHCLYGMSTDWTAKGAYAAFGTTQQPERGNTTEMWNDIANDYNNFKGFTDRVGDPWDDYLLGLTQTPGQTGGQRDFSMLEGGPELFLGAAEVLDLYQFLATEETKRPGHYFEYDCRNVNSIVHPRWIVWGGRTHWHTGVSTDRLGKTDPDLGGYFHGWQGKDWEHHSSNLLTFAALMTGSYLLLDEVNNEVELYISGHTLPSMLPGWSTNDRFAARAFGRTHHAMVNHFLLTGRQDLKTRMIERFRQCVVNFWDGATHTPVKNWLHMKDARILSADIDAWVPWNESLGVVGAVALYNVTQDTQLLSFLVAWSVSIMKYGWRKTVDANGAIASLYIGQGVQWYATGQPPVDYTESTQFIPAFGFETWGIAVIKVIRDNPGVFATEDVAMANEYYNYLYSHRDARDIFSDWGRWSAIKLQQV